MQMNTATAFAILAFTSSALARWDSYSYGNEVYAREAEPEFDDYSLYAREEYDDEDSLSHLSARDLIEEYVSHLSARSQEAQEKLIADTKTKDAATVKDASAGAEVAKHKAEIARLHQKKEKHRADKQHKEASEIEKQIAELQKKAAALEGKANANDAAAKKDGKIAGFNEKKAKDLGKKAGDAKAELASLSRRALIEEIYGEYDW